MTITEIAKMAEVSVSAVSRYLNNGYVSEEKAKRIKKVIEKTGYRPSKQAQSMRTGKSRVIGVILPKISSESIARVADGISEVLSAAGYQMLLTSTENSSEKEIEYLQLLNNNPVDGILFSASVYDKAHKDALKKLDVPVVIISQKFEEYACVFHDDYGAACAMSKKLIESGKRHIGHICVNQKDKAAGVQRTKAFYDTMEKCGMPVEPDMVVESSFTMDGGYTAMEKLMKQNPDLDGVFCATDSLAVGAMMYLRESGKQIPEDVAVAGIGHNRMSRVVTPTLATAHLHYRTSGVEAAKMLVEMLEEENVISKQLMLGYEVVEAESISSENV